MVAYNATTRPHNDMAQKDLLEQCANSVITDQVDQARVYHELIGQPDRVRIYSEHVFLERVAHLRGPRQAALASAELKRRGANRTDSFIRELDCRLGVSIYKHWITTDAKARKQNVTATCSHCGAHA